MYPSFTPPVLHKLRNLVLQRQGCCFCKEFVLYLLDVYPKQALRYSSAHYLKYSALRKNWQEDQKSSNQGGRRQTLQVTGWYGLGFLHFKAQVMRLFHPAPQQVNNNECFEANLIAGRMVFRSYINASFFNWDLGSTLFFGDVWPHNKHWCKED